MIRKAKRILIGFLLSVVITSLLLFQSQVEDTSTVSRIVVTEKQAPNPSRQKSACPPEEVFEEKSEKLKARVAESCLRYQHPKLLKQVNWDLYRHIKENGTQLNFYFNSPDIWWSNLAVVEKLQAIYTLLEKTGSRTAYTTLAKLSGFTGDLGHIHVHVDAEKGDGFFNGTFYLIGNAKSYKKAKHAFDNYVKFVVIRDPLERLHSGFVDKILRQDHYMVWLRPYMKSLKNQNIDKPTFKMFLEYLESLEDSSTFDKHYRPQALIAHPCAIRYDFITQTTDMGCSLPVLYKKLAPSQSISPGRLVNSTHDMKAIVSDMTDLVKRVLKKHYQIDYDIFGFEFPPYL